MKKLIKMTAALVMTAVLAPVHAADYMIDSGGMHALVQMRVKHLGTSWLYGRFNNFEGTFTYDEENPAASKAQMTVDMTSFDSNHAERDKHLRSDDFLSVDKFSEATFVSTEFIPGDNQGGELKGDLTIHGVTQPVSFNVTYVGGGDDPWGGYRVGFEAETSIQLADFGINPITPTAEILVSVEGIRQ